jgi:hypothetical protein
MRTFLRSRGIRLIAALAIATGTAGVASLTALSTTQASADPASVTGYVGVGADVTQDFFDSLSGADGANSPTAQFFTPITSSSATDDEVIDSYDAFPAGGSTLNPGCITTKFGGPSFDRPNSSTAGITALFDAVTDVGWENSSGTCTHATVNVEGEIDFARSARGPKTSGSTLTFIPYGRDGLGILVYDPTGTIGTSANPLTTANLQTIYSSTTGTSTIDGSPVEGCLTITGSTPRSNLESAIGVSDSTAGAEASLDGCGQIQQNSGNAFYTFAATLGTTDAVIPISSGDWIAQADGNAVDESNTARSKGLTLASITDGSNALGSPFTGSIPSLKPSTTYYTSSSYGYNLYTVLPTSKVSGENEDFGLASLFVGASSALCSTTFQNQMHNDYGFDLLSGSEGTCGTTTQTGNG